MLDSLRKFGGSWFGKILLAFLLIGLAGFGISNVITGLGSNTVAWVGGKEISVRDFQRAYNAQLNAVAAQTGSVPTAEQALAFGIPSAVINSLAADAALVGLAERLGLGASDERLGKMLREDPTFGGLLGQFDRKSFERALELNGFTEAEYLKALKETAQLGQISTATVSGVTMPETALELFNRYTSDTRVLDYFVLGSDAIAPPAEPTEAELQAYLEDHQSQYRTTATRTAEIVVLTPEALEPSIEISDDQIAAEYERTKAGLIKVETRDISQVVLETAEQQALFEDGLAAGKSFDVLVEEAGLTVTDLGTKSRGALVDAELAEAAFSLEEGAFALVPGAAGLRAVTVTRIVAGGQMSLEEARDQIIDKLRTSTARDMYVDVLDQIEELRAAFRPLDEIAERYGLSLHEVTLTSDGSGLAEVADIPEDGRQRVATAVFAQEMGDLAPGIALGGHLNVWFDLMAIDPARDQTLDEVRDEIAEAIMESREDAALAQAAEDAVTALQGGTPLADVAAGLSAEVQTSWPMTREGDGVLLTGPVVMAAFNGPQGHVGSAQNGEGNHVVFVVTGVTPADAEVDAQLQTAAAGAIRQDIYSAFVSGLSTDAGVRIAEGTLSRLLGLN